MDSCDDTPKGWVAPFGYPRINACSRLPVAFRSVPRPSSPPGAKASTECPYRARDRRHALTTGRSHHAQKPSSAVDRTAKAFLLIADITLAQHTTVASEHHCHRQLARQKRSGQTCDRQRPETHQNLIHPDKEHAPGRPRTDASIRRHLRHRSSELNHQCRLLSLLRDTHPTPRYPIPEPESWWRRSDSNRRPPACKAGALPAELRPLSISISSRDLRTPELDTLTEQLVGQGGFEPPTPRLSSVCSNQLSY